MQRLHWFKETINPVVCPTLQVRLDDQNSLFWCSCLKTYKYPDKLQLHLVQRWSNKIRELLLLLLKAQKFAYSPAETATSHPEINNAAALICLLFYLCYNFQDFPVQNVVRKLHLILLVMESQCFTKDYCCFSVPPACDSCKSEVDSLRGVWRARGSSQTLLLQTLSSKCFCCSPVLGPWVLAARMALSPPATTLTPTRLHTLSHWGREATGKRIFVWWPIGGIAIGKKKWVQMSHETFNTA